MGLCPASLVLIVVGFVILGGKSVVMVFLPDLETVSELFLDEFLGLFRYPPGSGRASLAGTLPLWYCAARFACRTPLGGCRFLVMLLIWLLLVLVLSCC